ncbi:MAG: FtsX-like permease family protein, partial [Myxococcaceae bacterium]
RMEIVDGTPVPKGQRGYLMPKFSYEEGFKLKTARRLDKIKEALEVGKKSIANDPELKRFVNENVTQTHDILLQFDPLKTKQVTEGLQKALGTTEADPDKLLQTLLQTTDENFQERYRIFYADVAPLLDLYRLKVGDMLSIKAFSRSGYVESVNVKVYGTFQFKGLEKSPLAGTTGLMDLMSFRDLYGYLSPDRKAEIAQLQQDSGAANVTREDAEDALFGDARQIVAEATPGLIEEAEHLDPSTVAGHLQQEDLLKRIYTQEEIDQGVVLNAAVMVKDKEKLEETMEALRVASKDAGLELKVVSWQESAGIIGQFVSMARMSVYTIVGIIFIVVVVILSNAVMMATLRRVREIGTMRAIGAQRGFVLSMIFTETVVLGVAFGLLGAAAGAGLITVIGNVGIPASTEELYFFFAGPRFFPSVSTDNLIAAVFVVLGISALSTFYPAFLATRVSPLEAMQSDD